jgi:hypothetical protein
MLGWARNVSMFSAGTAETTASTSPDWSEENRVVVSLMIGTTKRCTDGAPRK